MFAMRAKLGATARAAMFGWAVLWACAVIAATSSMPPAASLDLTADAEWSDGFDAGKWIAQPAGETIALSLPDIGRVTLVKKQARLLPSGNIAWEGHLPAPYQYFGAELVLTREGIFGDVRTPQGSVRIEPASDGRKSTSIGGAVRISHDPHELCSHGNHAGESTVVRKTDASLPVAAQVAKALASTDTAEADVLFVYTTEAMRRFGNAHKLAAAIDSIILSANAAATRSGLPLRFRAAASLALPLARPVHGDLNDLLVAATSGDDASLARDDAFQAVAKARAKYGADIVVLLAAPADYTVGCDWGSACTVGAAWQATPEGLWGSNAGQRAYLAVNVYASDLNRAVVHELGHVFGAGHDDTVGGGGLFTDSKAALWDGGDSGTVMSYAPNAVMMFSNASVACGGQPCAASTSVATDNARTLRATRFAVAGLRERQWWTARLDGLWWDPSRPGWGVQLSLRGDRVDALWLAYDASGVPSWYAVEDCHIENNICRGDVFRYWTTASRSHFADAVDVRTMFMSRVGELELDLSVVDAPRWRATAGGGGIDSLLSRQPGTSADAASWTGNWWLSWETSTGLGISETRDGLFLVWFGYDANGMAGWRIVPDCRFDAAKTRCDGDLYAARGPVRWGIDGTLSTDAVVIGRLGEAGLQLTGSGQARLRWREAGVGGEAAVAKILE